MTMLIRRTMQECGTDTSSHVMNMSKTKIMRRQKVTRSQAKFLGRLQPQNRACLLLPSGSSLARPVLTMRDRCNELSKLYVILSLKVVLPLSLSLSPSPLYTSPLLSTPSSRPPSHTSAKGVHKRRAAGARISDVKERSLGTRR